MNAYQIKLYALVALHMAVWLFAVLGGLFSCRVAKLNMLVTLPIIFVLQISLKSHIFIKAKADLIKAHPGAFGDAGVDEAGAYRVMHAYEDDLLLPRITHAVSAAFKDQYQNPMSAQGMLVLGYIANACIYLLWCRAGCR